MRSSPEITKDRVYAGTAAGSAVFEDTTDHLAEQRLILALCQTAVSPEAIDESSKILSGGVDWEYVRRIVHRNAVLTLFSWNLLNNFADQLPDGVRRDLTDDLHAYTRKNMYQTAKVGELVRFFAAHGIEALPFKGSMLAIQAYGNPAHRMYGDLDILVQPRHFNNAVKLLTENGYNPLTSVSWIKKTNWYIGRTKDIYFVNQDETVKLELHWKLSGSHFGLPKEMNGLWNRLEKIDLGGTPIPSLSFNDLLIYLCLHGSRHSWERLSWICDVNELIRSKMDIDWDSILQDARSFGCEKVVALSLRLIHDFFDFKVPISSGKSVDDGVYDSIVAEIRNRLFSDKSQQVEIGERYVYHLKLKERSSDRLKLHYHYLSWYLKLLMTPNEMDKDVLHFPIFLSPLYYVTRPVRLIYSFMRNKISPEKTSGL